MINGRQTRQLREEGVWRGHWEAGGEKDSETHVGFFSWHFGGWHRKIPADLSPRCLLPGWIFVLVSAYHGNGVHLFLLFFVSSCQRSASGCLGFNLPFWMHKLEYRIRIHKNSGIKTNKLLTCRKDFLLACGAFRPVRERVNARLGRWKHICRFCGLAKLKEL